MKRYINGKMYDTEKARFIGSDSNAGHWRDFNHYEESLYRKRTGEFFLYGRGGPMTKYRVSAGQNSWSGGESIIPLTIKEAEEWAEEHLSTDTYDELFGEITEDETLELVAYRIKASNAERIRRAMSETGKSGGAIIDELIENSLKSEY